MRNTTTIKVRLAVAWIVLLVWHFLSFLFKAPPVQLASQEVLDTLNKNQFWYCITDFAIWYIMATIIKIFIPDRIFQWVAVTVQDISIFLCVVVLIKETFDWSMGTVVGFFITLAVSVPLFWLNNKMNNLIKTAKK